MPPHLLCSSPSVPWGWRSGREDPTCSSWAAQDCNSGSRGKMHSPSPPAPHRCFLSAQEQVQGGGTCPLVSAAASSEHSPAGAGRTSLPPRTAPGSGRQGRRGRGSWDLDGAAGEGLPVPEAGRLGAGSAVTPTTAPPFAKS